MTLPNERRLAVTRTEKFLMDLLDPKKTPRVPKNIRDQAASLLRHYPHEYHMEEAREKAASIFGEWDSDYDSEYDNL